MGRRVVIVGAGIVGTALAGELSARGCAVTVLDQAPEGTSQGSTGRAPGFVGTYNEAPVLTELARESVARYRELGGFEPVGGLEIAQGAEAAEALEQRAEAARAAGLRARLIGAAQAAGLAPRLVDPEKVTVALHFPDDGTARAGELTAAQRARSGATFVDGAVVTEVEKGGVYAGGEFWAADDVVLANGIWAAKFGLPLVPVAHPYVYGPKHATQPESPFVRWPQHHVYARDHGERDGFGTYDHEPVPVRDLAGRADLPWPGAIFDDAIAAASELMPARHRFEPEQRLNGVFSMTADNLPLVGRVEDGLWAAVAVWVTHAAGAAALLGKQLIDDEPGGMLDPHRFDGVGGGELEARALRLYRGIYHADQGERRAAP
ncbi:NAD(P)/FAD-dependent oxidoreductase [Amycolatopsis magusensis]|uniref:NAD(P)/FAD-dependent oxidoreductase n=1 Tax=Amycolatopsis magusensis TaxID=882444 RepID=UPI0037B7AC69